ncbi:MAG: hypothetical protein DLM50_00740 [Candidatus Meridianibacter frigidus]|nr:MAG: hypothetical protein DLM50_00740 [Candidatus Eremiobacteraeota bacterium]
MRAGFGAGESLSYNGNAAGADEDASCTGAQRERFGWFSVMLVRSHLTVRLPLRHLHSGNVPRTAWVAAVPLAT